MTDESHNESLCVICDAPPGQCNHTGHRYYDEPVRLIPKYDKNGKRIGSVVAPEDKERWNAPLHKATPPEKPTEQPKPIRQLIVELEAWIDVTHTIEDRIRSAYDHAPLRVTRSVAHVVAGAERKTLTNPAGLLLTRLHEILTRPAEHTPEPEPEPAVALEEIAALVRRYAPEPPLTGKPAA